MAAKIIPAGALIFAASLDETGELDTAVTIGWRREATQRGDMLAVLTDGRELPAAECGFGGTREQAEANYHARIETLRRIDDERMSRVNVAARFRVGAR
jgi:hypothetical protein